MKIQLVVFVVLLSLSVIAVSQDNDVIQKLFNADQAARQTKVKDWEEIYKQDSMRRAEAMRLLKNNKIKTSKDYYHAAFIFQHGDTKEDIRLAHAFATISSVLSDDPSKANWIKAATWDRLMLRYEQPQWFGTQLIKDENDLWVLYEVESNLITDAERESWSVPSLDKMVERVKQMNQRN